MTDPFRAIRELAQRALQTCDGQWNAAEQLMHRWLTEDLAVKQQIIDGLLEFHIRQAITTEGRRQHQHAAEHRRDAIVAYEQAQETAQIVDELIHDLDEPHEGGQSERRPR
jgi:hypothetical protein